MNSLGLKKYLMIKEDNKLLLFLKIKYLINYNLDNKILFIYKILCL